MIRVACIGIGNWGKALVRAFDEIDGVSLVFCCDISQQPIKSIQVRNQACRWTRDYRQVLSDESVDAVIIATPTQTHYPIAKDSLLAGKHVFVEKPISMTSSEAQELADLAERNGIKLMVGHLLLYHPAIEKMKELIKIGVLGMVYYLYSQRINLGVIRTNENALWSLAPHDVSVILHLLEEFPREVTAQGECYLQQGVQDVVFLTLRFPGKKMAQIHLSWLDPHKERRLTIVGSKKMAVFDDMAPSEKVKVYDKGAEIRRDFDSYGEYIALRAGDVFIPKISNIEPLKLECRHFIDSIRFDKTPLSDGTNGLEVVRIIEAAQRSLTSGGQPVSLEREFSVK